MNGIFMNGRNKFLLNNWDKKHEMGRSRTMKERNEKNLNALIFTENVIFSNTRFKVACPIHNGKLERYV